MGRCVMRLAVIAGLVHVFFTGVSAAQQDPSSFGLGRAPTAAEIQAWDIAVGPEGKELPPGQGTARDGAPMYQTKCAMCHGVNGTEGPQDVLVGGRGSLATTKPVRTIGSFWPYATTIYDYISRAMPLYAPGSLSPHEVYALTAYLLFRNDIIDESTVIDAQTLPKITMPNRDGFRPDPRPEQAAP